MSMSKEEKKTRRKLAMDKYNSKPEAQRKQYASVINRFYKLSYDEYSAMAVSQCGLYDRRF